MQKAAEAVAEVTVLSIVKGYIDYHQNHYLGVTYGTGYGISIANGRYIAMREGDDWGGLIPSTGARLCYR